MALLEGTSTTTGRGKIRQSDDLGRLPTLCPVLAAKGDASPNGVPHDVQNEFPPGAVAAAAIGGRWGR